MQQILLFAPPTVTLVAPRVRTILAFHRLTPMSLPISIYHTPMALARLVTM